MAVAGGIIGESGMGRASHRLVSLLLVFYSSFFFFFDYSRGFLLYPSFLFSVFSSPFSVLLPECCEGLLVGDRIIVLS